MALNWTGSYTYFSNTTISDDITLVGNTTINVTFGATVTITGTISGSYSVTKEGTGTLILTDTNTYSGGTTVSDGTLYLGYGTATGSIVGDVTVNGALNGTLIFSRTDDYTFPYNISGTGGVHKYQEGKTILTCANSYTGGTRVYNGTLQIGNGSSTTASIGSTSSVNLSGATSTLRFEPKGDMIFNKVIAGNGKVEYAGATAPGAANRRGRLYLGGNNTYSGGTTITNGAIWLSGDGRITSNIMVNKTFEDDANLNGSIVFDDSHFTFSGIISGNGDVRVGSESGGNVTFGGVNTYTGNACIYKRTLTLDGSGKIENSDIIMYSNSVLDVSAGDKKIKSLNSWDYWDYNCEVKLGAGKTLTIGTAGEDDGGGYFAGKFTGNGNVTKKGTGELYPALFSAR